jgi:hypothetical protein
MYCAPIHKTINVREYDYIVSLGNKCPTTDTLRNLGLYKESFPFDYIPTTPKLILKYLQDQTEFFPEKNVVRTKDDVWFGHFDVNSGYDITIDTFKRRFQRLFDILPTSRILFVYTSEADVYNEMGNRYNDNYGDLCKLRDYLIETYNSNFTIAAFHVNKEYVDCFHITNYTIKVAEMYLSDDMSTHVDSTCSLYRNCLRQMMQQVFINR